MNKKKYIEVIRDIAMLGAGILIGLIGYIVSDHFSLLGGVTLLVLNLIIIAFMQIESNVRYSRRISDYLARLTERIKEMTESDEYRKTLGDKSEDLQTLYEAIEKLRTTLKHQSYTKDTVINIVNTIAVNNEIDKLLEELLPKVIDGTRSNWGAFYIYNNSTSKLELKASQGFAKNIYKDFDIEIGEGFIGAPAARGEIEIINNIPEDTIYISRTFLGVIKPRSIMIVPIQINDEPVAVLTLAGIHDYTDKQKEIVSVIRYYLGVAVINGVAYEHSQRLASELQFQNQLIQSLNDELEEKVHERTDSLNSIIDNIRDHAIISFDTNLIINTWNKGAEQICGYTQDEVIGISVLDTYPSGEVGKMQKKIDIARTEGSYIEYGWNEKRSGERYFAQTSINAMYDKSSKNIIGFTSMVKDITVTRSLEQALMYEKTFNKKILENSTRALVLSSKSGYVLTASDRAVSILGKRQLSDIVNNSLSELFIGGEDIKRILSELSTGLGRREWTMQLNDKTSRAGAMLLINATVLDDDDTDDDMSGILIYFKDVERE